MAATGASEPNPGLTPASGHWRNRGVHDALRALAVDAGALLTSALEAGEEVSFELLEEGDDPHRAPFEARGPILYRYRPLTHTFVAERWDRVRDLESYRRASRTLGTRSLGYLRHRGLRGTTDDALRDVVQRTYREATEFKLPEARFERVYAELDAMLDVSTITATVAAPVNGVRLARGRVDLGDGLALVRRAAIDPPPLALEGALRASEATAEAAADEEGAVEASPLDVYCLLERELPAAASLPIGDARIAFRRMLAGLRLSGAGGTALGPLAWARADAGAWHPVALGVSARARPDSWELRHADESELRDLLDVLAHSRHGGSVAWALDRFEMGCDRELATEALSDHLLALRALLADPHGDGDAGLALRLAALCGAAEERGELQRRVMLAATIERALMAGGGGSTPLDSPRALVREIEQHLRALLRDVLCGYLDEDLRRTADEVLLASGGVLPGEVHARDLRAEAVSEADTTELDAISA